MELKYISPSALKEQLREEAKQKAQAKRRAEQAKVKEEALAKRRAEQEKIEAKAVAERNAQLAEWSAVNQEADLVGISPFEVLDREARIEAREEQMKAEKAESLKAKGLKAKPTKPTKPTKPKPIKKAKAIKKANANRKYSRVVNGKRVITLKVRSKDRLVYEDKKTYAYKLHVKKVEENKRKQAQAKAQKKVRSYKEKAAEYRKKLNNKNKDIVVPCSFSSEENSSKGILDIYCIFSLKELKALCKVEKEKKKANKFPVGYNNSSTRKTRNNSRSLSERQKGKTSAKTNK